MPWRQRTSIPPKQVLTCTVQHKEFELALARLASSFAQRPSFSRSKSSDVERSLFCLELWFLFRYILLKQWMIILDSSHINFYCCTIKYETLFVDFAAQFFLQTCIFSQKILLSVTKKNLSNKIRKKQRQKICMHGVIILIKLTYQEYIITFRF